VLAGLDGDFQRQRFGQVGGWVDGWMGAGTLFVCGGPPWGR